MGEKEDKIEQNTKREDCTDLSVVYWFKIFVLIIVILVGIVLTYRDFKSLLVTAFTFLIGVVFDFIVIIMKNSGPRIKLRNIITIISIIIIASGIIICVVSMTYLLQYGMMDGSYMNAIQYYIRSSMICGILSPFLELITNKPPDD